MNLEFLGMIVQLILALGVTLGVMFLSFKLMGSKLNVISSNKYIKVIERVQVTKDNSILIVKIGEKGYIMTSTAGNMEKLAELSKEEISTIEEDKKKASQEVTEYYANLILKSKRNFMKLTKNIKSKEERHEK